MKLKKMLLTVILIIGVALMITSCSGVEITVGWNLEDEINALLASTPFTFIDFEAIPHPTSFAVGNVFVEDGVNMIVTPFTWSSGIVFAGGSANTAITGSAGHAGHDMNTNNVNIRFNFNQAVNRVVLYLGEYGGNMNISINGAMANLSGILGMGTFILGGVEVNVLTLSATNGIILLKGNVNDFYIGGQEFFIDHVGFRNI